MVDVGHKNPVHRIAEAQALIRLSSSTLNLLERKALPKGDVLTVAQIAGIQAAKETARFIPLCHPLPLDVIHVHFKVIRKGIEIYSEVSTTAKTGVEMEALTAVSVAALTIYDMCKAVDSKMVIGPIKLTRKIKKALKK